MWRPVRVGQQSLLWLLVALIWACGPSPGDKSEPGKGAGELTARENTTSVRSAPNPPSGPYVVVLGTAQDGGNPQVGERDLARWDAGNRQLATSIALVDPGARRRYLFEATPDLAAQLVSLDRIAPNKDRPGLDGVFLTHAHVGHYVGLFFFGFEVMGAQGLPVYAMPLMRSFLRDNGPWSQLVDYQNITLQPLENRVTVDLGELEVTPLEVPHRREFAETVAFRIAGPERSVLFLPDIDGWEEWDALGVRVEDEIASVDVAYLDGSFWFHGEIPGRDMSGFPHPMIKESLDRFSALPAPERAKIRWIHLNHTNPAARVDSPERREIEAAGMRVAEQGEIVEL